MNDFHFLENKTILLNPTFIYALHNTNVILLNSQNS